MSFEFPDLQRPQYPSSPEVLLSALAWSVVRRQEGKEGVGLIYERRPSAGRAGGPKKVVIEQTRPRGQSMPAFLDELRHQGLADLSGTLTPEVAEAVANSMTGVPPLKGVGCASSAVGVAGALLQDGIGGLATANPPNFAHLLNTMYVLGGGSGPTAAEQWFTAARHHAGSTRLRPIENAFVLTTLAPFLGESGGQWPPTEAAPSARSRPGEAPEWWSRDVSGLGVGTPFSWFRSSWDRLCSPAWHQRLSPRRWASWAICVLRQALGFTFLWEASFYVELAKGVVDTSREPAMVARWAVEPPRPLVPFQRGSTSQMDVSPAIKSLLSTGVACRKAIAAVTEELGVDAADLTELVVALRTKSSPTQREAIRRAISGGGDTGGLPNVVETVRYSLLARSGVEEVDNYGLLRVVSRNYTHVSPGAEWIVVMSAMAAGGPADPVRLGDVMQSINALGFQPRIDFLLAELERAGLCASAADGDEGIEINLGFGGN